MKKRRGFDDLLRVMKRLRGPGGCPWDREQTHASLVKHLREESREVEQAIRKRDPDNLCEELGDLLLQIIFHADIAAESGHFTMADVVDDLARKMVRRHPHVFGDKKLATARDVVESWDEIKKAEKAARARDLAGRRKNRLTLRGKTR